ncbi:MAG TPA: hypothetical protein VGV35_12830, partial [Bryobacteraceae bacterium]|nr:hypothetical protein [Bryobacteraceae bacterium]
MKFLPPVALFLLVLCPPYLAQTSPPAAPATAPADNASKFKDPLNRETPQSAVTEFLESCHAKNYERAQKYLDLRKLSQAERTKNGQALAQELSQILGRDAQFDVAALSRQPEGEPEPELPPNSERVASFKLGDKTADVLLERITLRRGHSIWLFSSG